MRRKFAVTTCNFEKKKRKADWICHIFCGKFLLKNVIEGKLEGTGKRGRRRKQLLDVLKETKRCCKVKEEALDRTVGRTRFGQGCGPVVRQTAQCNECRASPVAYMYRAVKHILTGLECEDVYVGLPVYV
jgi:hypothetical protein